MRAICEVQLGKRAKYSMLMFGLKETMDQLGMQNSVHWYGHVLWRGDGHVLWRGDGHVLWREDGHVLWWEDGHVLWRENERDETKGHLELAG